MFFTRNLRQIKAKRTLGRPEDHGASGDAVAPIAGLPDILLMQPN